LSSTQLQVQKCGATAVLRANHVVSQRAPRQVIRDVAVGQAIVRIDGAGPGWLGPVGGGLRSGADRRPPAGAGQAQRFDVAGDRLTAGGCPRPVGPPAGGGAGVTWRCAAAG
jgi:hypothetical protein